MGDYGDWGQPSGKYSYFQPYSNEYMDSLYRRLSNIESSNGTQKDKHKTLTAQDNIPKEMVGQTAGGETGIVPGTLQYLNQSARNAQLAIDPKIAALSELAQRDPDAVTNLLNTDQGLDRAAFEQVARTLLNRTGGDENKVALAWNTGTSKPKYGSWSKVPQTVLDNNEYVQKFKKNKKDFPIASVDQQIGRQIASPSSAKDVPHPDEEFDVEDMGASTLDDLPIDNNKINALKAYRNSIQ